MRVTHRPAAVRGLAALAFGLAALTGCGGGEDDGQAAAPAPALSASPSASAESAESAESTDRNTAPGGGTEPSDASPPSGTAPWAGTKQFVQIDTARTSDGQTYLSVRPARKKAHDQFEAWVITPGKGPYTEVRMTGDAKVLLSVPLGDAKHAGTYSQAEFVSRLATRPTPDGAVLGFDVSFDGEGRVTRLQSLYTP